MQHLGLPFAQRFAYSHQEPARPAGRIADNVCRLWLDHFDHQPDDVTRRAELAVLSSRRDLAQHVLEGYSWIKRNPQVERQLAKQGFS